MKHSDKFLHLVKNAKAEPTDPISANFIKFQDGSDAIVIGLSRREYYAAMAMQAALNDEHIAKFPPAFIADLSVKQADALIEALNK